MAKRERWKGREKEMRAVVERWSRSGLPLAQFARRPPRVPHWRMPVAHPASSTRFSTASRARLPFEPVCRDLGGSTSQGAAKTYF